MSETTIENATATAPKPTKSKAAKNPAKAKAAAPRTKPAKAARPPKEKKPKAPREDRTGWGTFALRLPIPERDAFHTAAGPANASRAARIVLNAFSNEDETAFKSAITEARKLRA